eukprot:3625651-Rhodomonas_salina.1
MILRTHQKERRDLRIRGFVHYWAAVKQRESHRAGTFYMTVLTVVTVKQLSLHHPLQPSSSRAFVPPAYQPAAERRKFLGSRGTVQYAYEQCAVPPLPARCCTLQRAACSACTCRAGVPGYAPVPTYASTL